MDSSWEVKFSKIGTRIVAMSRRPLFAIRHFMGGRVPLQRAIGSWQGIVAAAGRWAQPELLGLSAGVGFWLLSDG